MVAAKIFFYMHDLCVVIYRNHILRKKCSKMKSSAHTQYNTLIFPYSKSCVTVNGQQLQYLTFVITDSSKLLHVISLELIVNFDL